MSLLHVGLNVFKDMSKKRKLSVTNPVSRAHVCSLCKQTGHHATRCPSLAQKALKALTKFAQPKELQAHLAAGKPLKVLDVVRRPKRSLKKASGKRGKRVGWKKSVQSKTAKTKKKKKAKKKNTEKDRNRISRSAKKPDKQQLWKFSDVRNAYRRLLTCKWLWHPNECSCGGVLTLEKPEESQHRGVGRMFLRCSECRLWKDVLTYSHLPRVRMPLPHVLQAMCIFFRTVKIPSLNEMAAEMGYNGHAGGCLAALRNSLLHSCARCAVHEQRHRQLSGVVEADATSLRKAVVPGSTTLRYFQAFGVVQRDVKRVNLYDLGHSDSVNIFFKSFMTFNFCLRLTHPIL